MMAVILCGLRSSSANCDATAESRGVCKKTHNDITHGRVERRNLKPRPRLSKCAGALAGAVAVLIVVIGPQLPTNNRATQMFSRENQEFPR
jgi:hypothetical protein